MVSNRKQAFTLHFLFYVGQLDKLTATYLKIDYSNNQICNLSGCQLFVILDLFVNVSSFDYLANDLLHDGVWAREHLRGEGGGVYITMDGPLTTIKHLHIEMKTR